ncbi:MAG TPA: dipeptidase [Nitriliruptorales bacterium]
MDAASLHADATVVDTHNDLILLVDHHDRRYERDHFGEFWLPQLRAGGVDVQVLPVYIDTHFLPEGALRRTLLLIERIHELADEHADDVAVCLSGADIDAAVAAGRIALVIALEGAPAIGQDPALIRTLHRLGVRVVSFTHLGRTLLADGSGLDDTSNSRLTREGIEVFGEMERLGIVFDISHLGLGGVEHVLEIATRPFIATHSACRALTDVHRNLHDEHLKGIAAHGGVIGIAAAIPMFIDPQRPTVGRVVDHIEHLADVCGIDHVGVGPDFIDDYYQAKHGGWVLPPDLDVPFVPAEISRPEDLPRLTQELLDRGFGDDDVRKVLGGNFVRVFREVLGAPRT